MSELDADLYGDLYGDDNEFAVPLEEFKEENSEKLEQKRASPPPSQKVHVESNPVQFSSPAPKTPQQDSSSSSTFSQIPTYSSSMSDQYTGHRTHGGQQRVQPYEDYQTISSSYSGGDRSVRPSEMKEEGKMFIGGLNWDTTDDNLKKYFEQFGKVEACTIMRDANGRSRCFAFLTFEDPASVNAVMVREHVLDGKIIDPKRAIPRLEHQRAQKLFIGGLAATVTSESMREFFSQFGKVIDSTVMLDRETGRSKGFGFVSFEDANVEPILGFGKLEIDGKMIDVKLAQPRYQRDHSAREGPQDSRQSSGSYGAQNVQAAIPTSQTSTPFDPQALAQLYTRMFQQFGGAGMMNMAAMGMGGMNPMMGGNMSMGNGGNFGMNSGMGRIAGTPNSSGGASVGLSGNVGGLGRGSISTNPATASGPPNAPKGPRGAGGGLGPQRSQRGPGYHPYSR